MILGNCHWPVSAIENILNNCVESIFYIFNLIAFQHRRTSWEGGEGGLQPSPISYGNYVTFQAKRNAKTRFTLEEIVLVPDRFCRLHTRGRIRNENIPVWSCLRRF